MHTSKGSQKDLPGDVSLQSEIKDNYLFDTTEAEPQSRSFPNETEGFPDIDEQSRGTEFLRNLRVISEICKVSPCIYYVFKVSISQTTRKLLRAM